MQEVKGFLTEVDRFCARHGRAPATLANQATGNSYVLETMPKRADRMAEQMAEIRAVMAYYDQHGRWPPRHKKGENATKQGKRAA